MIGTGLIITTMICLGLSTNGVLEKSTPFLNQDNNIIEKEKKQATGYEEGKYTYEYELGYSVGVRSSINWNSEQYGPETPINNYIRYNSQTNNEIFDLKLNTYITFITWQGNGEIQNPYSYILPEEKNGLIQTGVLEIYQITPYKYTYENKLKITIGNRIINNLVSIGGKTKFLRNTYITTENLSAYMNSTTFNTPYWIANKELELNNPNLGYQYTKKQEIVEYIEPETENATTKDNVITQEYELIGNTTNYIVSFYYLDPKIQDTQWPQSQQDTKYQQFFTKDNNNIFTYYKLITKGNFIPPIESYEVIDIPGLMFQILTLPFSFISVAFNLTLFPGTMYQINLANLFLAVIGVLIFIFVINILIKRN